MQNRLELWQVPTWIKVILYISPRVLKCFLKLILIAYWHIVHTFVTSFQFYGQKIAPQIIFLPSTSHWNVLLTSVLPYLSPQSNWLWGLPTTWCFWDTLILISLWFYAFMNNPRESEHLGEQGERNRAFSIQCQAPDVPYHLTVPIHDSCLMSGPGPNKLFQFKWYVHMYV